MFVSGGQSVDNGNGVVNDMVGKSVSGCDVGDVMMDQMFCNGDGVIILLVGDVLVNLCIMILFVFIEEGQVVDWFCVDDLGDSLVLYLVFGEYDVVLSLEQLVCLWVLIQVKVGEQEIVLFYMELLQDGILYVVVLVNVVKFGWDVLVVYSFFVLKWQVGIYF